MQSAALGRLGEDKRPAMPEYSSLRLSGAAGRLLVPEDISAHMDMDMGKAGRRTLDMTPEGRRGARRRWSSGTAPASS